ncbi:MAG: hypothetical protein ACM3OO_11070 [Planctomycetaceae bacterium]
MNGARARAAGVTLLVALSLVVVAWGFLSAYPSGSTVPKGADTPQYVWELRSVAGEGLDALPTFRGSHLLNSNADRPALPVVFAFLHALGGPDSSGFVFVLPAVLAVALGMIAVGLSRRGLAEPRLSAPVYALVAGVGLPLAFAGNGKFDELMAATLMLAGVALLMPALRGERPPAAGAALLFVAAWSAHWMVAAVIAVALCGTVPWIWLVPGLGLDDRGVVIRRFLAVFGVAALGVVVVTLLAPALPQPPLAVTAAGVAANVERQVPAALWSPLLPAAAVGVVVLFLRPGDPRAGLGPLLSWAALAVAGLAAAAVASGVPSYRLLSISLTLPVLAAAGVSGLARLLAGSSGRVRAGVAVVVVLVAAAALAADTIGAWRARTAASSASSASIYAALGRAVEGTSRPVVLVVDDARGDPAQTGFGTIPALRRFRAGLPADVIARSAVYLGDPQRLLEGEPTLRPHVPGFDDWSREAWRGVAPLVPDDPIVVIVPPHEQGFDALASAYPGWRVASWLLAPAGGIGGVPSTPPPLPPIRWSQLLRWTLLTLAVLAATGIGWSLLLVGGDFGSRVALAPALGLAVLAIAGLILEAAGGRSGGAAGPWTAALVAMAGIVAAWWARRRRTRRLRTAPRTTTPVSAARSG